MDPPKTPRTRSPQRGHPAWLIPTGHQHGSLTSLCFHPIPLSTLWIPGQAPKSAGSGFATPSIRTKHKGETGVAAAPNTWDVPHLELLEMPHTWSSHIWMFPQLEVVPAAGKGQAQTPPCFSWKSFPSSSRSTDPCHPTLPPQWGQHLQMPKKTNQKGENPPASTQNSASPNMCHSPFHTSMVKKKKPGIKHKPKAENTERSLMEFPKMFPAGRASEICFGDINDNKLSLPSDASISSPS